MHIKNYDSKLAMEKRLQRSLNGDVGVVTGPPVSLKTKSFGLQGGVSRLAFEDVGEFSMGLGRLDSSPSLYALPVEEGLLEPMSLSPSPSADSSLVLLALLLFLLLLLSLTHSSGLASMNSGASVQ